MQSSHSIDKDLAAWNDRMYVAHPTPYSNGLAGLIQRHRVKAIYRAAAVKSGERLLELGCESGKLLLECPEGVHITGADISTRALADAQALFKSINRKAEWLHLDVLQPLPFSAGSFDVIICSEMLEHVSHPEQALDHIAAICTSSTRVVVTVPIEPPKVLIKSVLSKVGLLRILFPRIEKGQSEWHLQSFSKSMLLRLVQKKFSILTFRNIWGCHLLALLRLKF